MKWKCLLACLNGCLCADAPVYNIAVSSELGLSLDLGCFLRAGSFAGEIEFAIGQCQTFRGRLQDVAQVFQLLFQTGQLLYIYIY